MSRFDEAGTRIRIDWGAFQPVNEFDEDYGHEPDCRCEDCAWGDDDDQR